jgi:hypothetical protein
VRGPVAGGAPRAARQFVELRKACAWYARGLRGANSLRQTVWALDTPDPIVDAAREFFRAQVGGVLTGAIRNAHMDPS